MNEFLAELQRRKVVRVGAVYLVTAWLIVQVIAVVNEPLKLPDWFDTTIIVFLAIAFPIALVLAWAFEVTPDGVARRAQGASGSNGHAAAIGQSKMDYAIAGLLIVAIGLMLFRTITGPIQVAAPTLGNVLHNSIAVLPFENLSPDPDDAYFAAGIHEETLNQLAKIKDLSVIARTSVMRYSGTDMQIPEIAAELNVGAVMEGSVRYAGDKVRITAQLIDAETGAHLWSEAYDRNLADIFGIQSDIAANITDAMKVEFSIAAQRSIGEVLTENPQAYAHYLKAVGLMTGLKSVAPVHAELDQALALDPNFAAAVAAKAWVHGFEIITIFEDRRITPESQARNAGLAERYANQALKINPDETGAFVALSIVNQYRREWRTALAHAERAHQQNPNQNVVIAAYALCLEMNGLSDQAAEQWWRLAEQDPNNLISLLTAVGHLWSMAKWAPAISVGQRMVAIFPDDLRSHAALAFAAAWGGDHALARNALTEAEKLAKQRGSPGTAFDVGLFNMILAYKALGDHENVQRLYAHALENGLNAPHFNELKGGILIAAGKHEAAIDLLMEAANGFMAPSTTAGLSYYSSHPLFDDIRDHPRFQEALRIAQQTTPVIPD
jgi:TolB-like protein